MTSRRGRRVRRKVPNISRTPEDNQPSPEITCPHCNETFPAVFEKPLCTSLTCPHCKVNATEADYAKTAVLLSSRRLEHESLVRKLSRPAKAARSFADTYNGALPGIIRAASNACGWLLERLTSVPINQAERSIKAASAHSKVLAHDGYYASAWYCRTRTPLHDSGKTSLEARYSRSGQLRLTVRNRALSDFGSIGEFSVFSLLQKQTNLPGSPLYGCILVPNLYVPIQKNQHKEGMSYWRQIDLVILAPECACVVEVKHWASDVFVNFKTGDIFATKAPESTYGNRKPIERNGKQYFFRGSLDQNSAHAEAFDAVCEEYPFDRIFEATIFNDCHQFESGFESFDNNVYAGAFDDNRQELVKALGAVRTDLDPLLSEDGLSKLAESLLERFGDLNQKRGPIHAAALDRRG